MQIQKCQGKEDLLMTALDALYLVSIGTGIYVLPVIKEGEIRMPGDISTCRVRCRKYIQKVGY